MQSRIVELKDTISNTEWTPEQYQQKEMLIQEYEAEQKKILYMKRCLNCSAPYDKVKEAGFHKWKSFSDADKRFLNLLKEYSNKLCGLESSVSCSDHGNLVVLGESGTGKTFAALSVIKFLCGTRKANIKIGKFNTETEQWQDVELDEPIYRNCYYTKSTRLVSTQMEKNPEEKRNTRLLCSNSDFLVIDEVGRSLQPKIEREIIFDILDNRLDNRKATMIISNLEDEELKSHLGSAVVSRLLSDCVYFNTAGIQDRRQKW